jgi:hypothetical protein
VRIAVLLVAAAAAIWFVVHRQHAQAAEDRYAAIASTIAKRPVHVACQGAFGAVVDVSGEAGYVQFDAGGRPSDTTHLKRFVCKALARMEGDLKRGEFSCVYGTFTCSRRVQDDIQALHTLTHESWHLSGLINEGETECHALVTVAYTATQFGADVRLANAIAHWIVAYIYPNMPWNYKQSCL